MKFPKLVKLSRELLDDKQASTERLRNLKEIQHKLKKKAHKLKEKYIQAQDEETKKSISQKLAVVTAQRKKVINELRNIDQKPGQQAPLEE